MATDTNSSTNAGNENNNNLLSPNAALEQSGGLHNNNQQQNRQRRRSTLSGNGFFIDYSRRRSSAMRPDNHQQALNNSQFLRTYVSPVRLPRNSFCVSHIRQQHRPSQQISQPVSPARAQSRQSRSSYSAAGNSSSGSSSMQLVLPFHAPNALAGSRKTSIFDPTGHSVASQVMVARRKSTMVPGSGGQQLMVAPTVVEPASTMLSVAKSAARCQGNRNELVQHVPVIGCSPTSIRASLAALDETRRYERLLKKLQRHQQRKERHRKLREKRLARGLEVDHWTDGADQIDGVETIAFGGDELEWPPPPSSHANSFRRKSLRALRDAAHLLHGSFRRAGGGGGPRSTDALSVSSMSFASSRSSLPSLDRFELINDELFLDENTMLDFNHPLAEQSRNNNTASSGSDDGNNETSMRYLQPNQHSNIKSSTQKRSSIVKSAMRRLAASISGNKQLLKSAPAQRARRSVSMGSGGMNYWYYYYYLRENSLDAVDDLPISSGPTTDAERRSQLHINYSLARIEILNSSTDPVARLAEKLSQAADMADTASCSGDQCGPIFNLLDFSQSTDVSMTLSTSSSSSSSSSSAASSNPSTSRGSVSSQSSNVSTVSGASSIESNLSASTSVNQRAFTCRPNQAALVARLSGSSGHSGRSHGRRGSDSADDECTSLEVDQSRISSSVSGHQKGISSRQGNKSSVDQRGKSMSGESIRAWPQQQQQLEAPKGSLNGGGGYRRSMGGVNMMDLPTSRSSMANADGSPRHSRNNLIVAFPVGVSSSSSTSMMTGSKRSASFASTPANRDNQSKGVEEAEEELDDFERLNRCHRGYKPPGSLISDSLPLQRDTSCCWPATADNNKTLSKRNSTNRLSVRSARCTRSSSSRGEARHRKRSSRISMSWDTLTQNETMCDAKASIKQAPLLPAVLAQQPTGPSHETTSASSGSSYQQRAMKVAATSRKSFKSGPASNLVSGFGPNHSDSPDQQLPEPQAGRRLGERLLLKSSPATTTTTTTGVNSDDRGEVAVSGEDNRRGSSGRKQTTCGGGGGPLVYGGSISASKLALDKGSGFAMEDHYYYYYYCDFHLQQLRGQQAHPSSSRDIIGAQQHQQKRQSPALNRRATSQSSIVDLGSTVPAALTGDQFEHHGSSLGVYSASLRRHQQQHPPRDGSKGSPDISAPIDNQVAKRTMEASASGGLHTSASLKVPEWAQGGYVNQQQQQKQQQANDAEPLNEGGRLRCQACAIARQQQQLARRSEPLRDDNGERVAWEQQGQSPRNGAQNRSIRSNDAAGSSAQVQLRARAHSTGAGSGHSVARNAASHATRERARLLSGIEGTSIEPLESLSWRQKAQLSGSGGELALTGSPNELPIQGQASGGAVSREKQSIELAAEEEGGLEGKFAESTDEEHRRKKDLLNKKSFTCMLVGARQTGKRTIVKCFVKLLNEFKLAAFEYKKEKMLTKLMDCSEQLQNLMDQQQQQPDIDDSMDRRTSLAPTDLPRSRINSWLGGGASGVSTNAMNSGGAISRFLNLPNAGKRRINSVVSAISGLTNTLEHQYQHQRRHTAIDHGLQLNIRDASESKYKAGDDFSASNSGRFLRVDSPNMLSACNRSSDTRINYTNDDDHDADNNDDYNESVKVPVPEIWPNQFSEPFQNNNSSRRPTQQQQLQPKSQQSPLADNDPRYKQHQLGPGRFRNLSMQAVQRRKPMLSLKEMNKRRVRILFKTRRQLSERFLNQQQQQNNNSNLEHQSVSNATDHLQWDWPDSFIVVYSISDRDSFEDAKLLISQLRSIKQDITLPVILVANKIDLERAKVVKSDEGRTLARKNACKFLEISCTVGFNLDNLLVGLRTQLILKHHITLNSIIRQSKSFRDSRNSKPAGETGDKIKGPNNILVRFYKRYLMDNQELNYDCDNFSKL